MKMILSIDVHGIVSIGLDKVVKEINEDWLVESASNLSKAHTKLKETKKWDLIILAITFNGKNGLDLLFDIKLNYSDVPVLMFSQQDGIEFVRRSFQLGANGYLTKDSDEKEISFAIKTVIDGGHYVKEEIRDELIFAPQAGDHTKLSKREFEVLLMIGKGYVTKEIADQLNLSVNTVETYRARIKDKMNLKRDPHLIHYCFANGLVKINPSIK